MFVPRTAGWWGLPGPDSPGNSWWWCVDSWCPWRQCCHKSFKLFEIALFTYSFPWYFVFGIQHIFFFIRLNFTIRDNTVPDSNDHHHVAHHPGQQDSRLEHGADDPIQGVVVLGVRTPMSSGERANYPIISLSWTKHLTVKKTRYINLSKLHISSIFAIFLTFCLISATYFF